MSITMWISISHHSKGHLGCIGRHALTINSQLHHVSTPHDTLMYAYDSQWQQYHAHNYFIWMGSQLFWKSLDDHEVQWKISCSPFIGFVFNRFGFTVCSCYIQILFALKLLHRSCAPSSLSSTTREKVPMIVLFRKTFISYKFLRRLNKAKEMNLVKFYGHNHNLSCIIFWHQVFYTRIRMWGLIENVKKGRLHVILGIGTNLKGLPSKELALEPWVWL